MTKSTSMKLALFVAIAALLSLASATAVVNNKQENDNNDNDNTTSQRRRRSLRKLQSDTATTTTTTTPYIVTLGDSYSSGLGIHKSNRKYDTVFGGTATYNGKRYRFTRQPGMCLRELDTTPGAMYASSIDDSFTPVMLACASAETADVEQQFDYLNEAMYPDQAANQWENSIIYMTVGGNDLTSAGGKGISGSILNCVTEFDPVNNCNDVANNQISNLDEVQIKLEVFFDKLVMTARKAAIRILGYPKIMQRRDNADCIDFGWANEEADWIDSGVVELNNRIEAAVDNVKQKYSDDSLDMMFVPVYEYMDKGACEASNKPTHVNGLEIDIFGGGYSFSSFHPSQLGYNAYYNALIDSL